MSSDMASGALGDGVFRAVKVNKGRSEAVRKGRIVDVQIANGRLCIRQSRPRGKAGGRLLPSSVSLAPRKTSTPRAVIG